MQAIVYELHVLWVHTVTKPIQVVLEGHGRQRTVLHRLLIGLQLQQAVVPSVCVLRFTFWHALNAFQLEGHPLLVILNLLFILTFATTYTGLFE
jgi:hypothetical protein